MMRITTAPIKLFCLKTTLARRGRVASLLLTIAISASAIGTSRFNCYFSSPGDSAVISYPVGRYLLMSETQTGIDGLSGLDAFIQSALSDSMLYVRRIHIIGYSSIEGSYYRNEQLSRRRAQGLHAALQRIYPYFSQAPVTVSWVPEDWETLRELVATSAMPDRKQLLGIMDEKTGFADREAALLNYKDGAAFRAMTKEYFPLLRRVEISVEYDVHRILADRQQAETEKTSSHGIEDRRQSTSQRHVAAPHGELGAGTLPADPWMVAVDSLPDLSYIDALEQRTRELRRLRRELCPLCEDVLPYFAVKSNMLYATIGSLNAAIEFKATKHLTIDIPVVYNPWTFANGRKWKHLFVQPEVRYWPGQAFLGHFVGAHLHAGTYDVGHLNWLHRTRHKTYDGWFGGVGISYGYLKPLTDNWHLEATVGLGYATNAKKHYLGPTRLGLSLVYCFRR